MRGTFGNIRLRNALADGTRGRLHHAPAVGRAAHDLRRRRALRAPRTCRSWSLAGKEYGSGSSRDWAAKGTLLLGVRAVIAESFERIHRSNLVGMGVLPLELRRRRRRSRRSASTGRERFTIRGIAGGVAPHAPVTVRRRRRRRADEFEVPTIASTPPADVEYLRHGGILPLVLRRMLAAA